MCDNSNIKDLLPDYSERKPGDPARKLVEEHLASCEDCRSELSLFEMMREDAVPDPGDAFWSEMPGRVYRLVQEQKSQKKALNLSRHGDWFILPRRAWAAAAAVIILLVTWFLINPFSGREEDGHLLTEVYDHGYGSIHDPALTHPSTNMSDLSASELDTVSAWAARELSHIASEAEPTLLNAADHELSEELADLNTDEIERVSTILKEYDEEG